MIYLAEAWLQSTASVVALQFFVDLFWQRQDFSADLADLETVHRGRDRFGITTQQGTIERLNSNYKQGIVLSEGQKIKEAVYARIQRFAKRQKHTKAEVKSLIGNTLKQLDLSQIKILHHMGLANISLQDFVIHTSKS